jgi:hypothetical protein
MSLGTAAKDWWYQSSKATRPKLRFLARQQRVTSSC